MKTQGINVSCKMLLYSMFCMFLFSCSNELQMNFPVGPEGPAGKSAYEVWVENVKNGNIDWSVDDTDEVNFFKYLKGKDGDNGKSAYEQWVDEVAKGIDNPHNSGTEWPKDETDVSDFWYYLTGANGENGLSAYELWKQDLENGNLPPKNGEKWDESRNTQSDFWEYLKGKDGVDGGVEQPGIAQGEYNVIAQYNIADHKEYVSWENGSVLFFVYDKQGNLMPIGTKVKLPRGSNPDKTYTLSTVGVLVVEKSDLPTSGDNNSYGKSQILVGTDWVDTYQNTYVPNKVNVRLRILTPGFNYYTSTGSVNRLSVPFRLERQVDPTKLWELIPSYVGTTNIPIKLYSVLPNGTTNDSGYSYYVNVTSANSFYINRKVIDSPDIQVSLFNSNFYWGTDISEKRYYTLYLDQYCYGDTLLGDVAVQDVPMQPAPLISKMVITEISELYFDSRTSYNTQNVINGINKDLLFENQYEVNTIDLISGFTVYSPVKAKLTDADILNNNYISNRFYYYNSITGAIDASSTALGTLNGNVLVSGARFESTFSIGSTSSNILTWSFFTYNIGVINRVSAGIYTISAETGINTNNISITN